MAAAMAAVAGSKALDVAGLQAELASARQGFDGWAASRTKALEAPQEQHADVAREAEGACGSLPLAMYDIASGAPLSESLLPWDSLIVSPCIAGLCAGKGAEKEVLTMLLKGQLANPFRC